MDQNFCLDNSSRLQNWNNHMKVCLILLKSHKSSKTMQKSRKCLVLGSWQMFYLQEPRGTGKNPFVSLEFFCCFHSWCRATHSPFPASVYILEKQHELGTAKTSLELPVPPWGSGPAAGIALGWGWEGRSWPRVAFPCPAAQNRLRFEWNPLSRAECERAGDQTHSCRDLGVIYNVNI